MSVLMEEPGEALLELVDASPGLTVEEFVKRVSEEREIRPDEAARILYELWEEEKVALEDPNPPRSALGYSSSLYSLWFWMLVLVVGLTGLSIYVLPQVPPFTLLRYVTGAISALYLPGASLIEALYPKEDDLEQLERLGLSVGLSLALTPLVGFVLNYTPWGIRLDPIFVSLNLLTVALAALAVQRKFVYFRMKVETAPFPRD